MKQDYIKPFSQINHNHLNTAGGKGANLGELSSHGFPVPPGFVVTTEAYDLFLNSWRDENQLLNQLENTNSRNLKDVRKLSGQLREELANIDIPANVTKAISKAIKDFSPEEAFAVRSSATAEDLPGASFAGQQDTFLNIKGYDAIINHVKKCWISLFTDRAVIIAWKKDFLISR